MSMVGFWVLLGKKRVVKGGMFVLVCGRGGAYPPIPTVKARSLQSRPVTMGISRCA